MRKTGLGLKLQSSLSGELAVVVEIHHIASLASVPHCEVQFRMQREQELLSANLGYEFDKTWAIQAEVFNLLNRKDSAIDYFYMSRLPGEAAAGVDDIHFHPTEPISFRIGLTAKF